VPFTFSFGTAQDAGQVQSLLADCGLPHEDASSHIAHFLLARSGDELAGCVGLEPAGSVALLRSLAVAEAYRRQGLSSVLYDRILTSAHARGIETLYVLTLSAGGFFRRRGFVTAERSSAPKPIAATREFASICPDSAEFMVRDIREDAQYFPKETLQLRPDVTGAKLWSVALRKTMLTYFEVEPHSRFQRHSHDSEQITMVLEGELFFELDSRLVRVGAGDVIAVPAGVPHAVYAQDSPVRAIDAWSPVPDQYRNNAEAGRT
jgi:amino-acid N-acetyltransferase